MSIISEDGRITIIVPIKPTKIAKVRRMPMVSQPIATLIKVANIGAVAKSIAAAASGTIDNV